MSGLSLSTLWGETCGFSTFFISTETFVTYDDSTKIVSVATTDACLVGDYVGFALNLTPDAYPSFIANGVYSFQVSIKCTVTSLSLPAMAAQTYLIGDSTHTAALTPLAVSPSHCQCLSSAIFTVSYTKDGVNVMNPSIITNDPFTDGYYSI